jgi:hypothetical protein
MSAFIYHMFRPVQAKTGINNYIKTQVIYMILEELRYQLTFDGIKPYVLNLY